MKIVLFCLTCLLAVFQQPAIAYIPQNSPAYEEPKDQDQPHDSGEINRPSMLLINTRILLYLNAEQTPNLIPKMQEAKWIELVANSEFVQVPHLIIKDGFVDSPTLIRLPLGLAQQSPYPMIFIVGTFSFNPEVPNTGKCIPRFEIYAKLPGNADNFSMVKIDLLHGKNTVERLEGSTWRRVNRAEKERILAIFNIKNMPVKKLAK